MLILWGSKARGPQRIGVEGGGRGQSLNPRPGTVTHAPDRNPQGQAGHTVDTQQSPPTSEFSHVTLDKPVDLPRLPFSFCQMK